MKNNIVRYITFTVALVLIVSSRPFAQTTNTSDESEIKKFEIGGQITVLRQRSYEDDSQVFDVNFPGVGPYRRLADNHQTEYGFGGRFTYNFNKNIAIEIEANYFPIDRLAREGKESARIIGTNEFFRVFLEPQGRKFQAVAGPKIGYRKKRFGIFAKVRPGLFYVERLPVIVHLSVPLSEIFGSERKAVFFLTDVGGVFELYPSKRTILRFDVGDTIIRYNAQEPKQFNPAFTRHTFQFSAGFGFRF